MVTKRSLTISSNAVCRDVRGSKGRWLGRWLGGALCYQGVKRNEGKTCWWRKQYRGSIEAV